MKPAKHFNMTIPILAIASLGLITGTAFGRAENLTAIVLGISLFVIVIGSIAAYGEIGMKAEVHEWLSAKKPEYPDELARARSRRH